MSYLRYLSFFAHNGVQHILSCVFCLVFLRLVYLMLPFSLGRPFSITPSVLSNVYFWFWCLSSVSAISWLPILMGVVGRTCSTNWPVKHTVFVKCLETWTLEVGTGARTKDSGVKLVVRGQLPLPLGHRGLST